MSVLEHSLISKAPELILEDVKRVKILATVGPATDSRQKRAYRKACPRGVTADRKACFYRPRSPRSKNSTFKI